MTTDEDLRARALDIAHRDGATGDQLLKRAEEVYQWLRHGSDGATEVRKMLSGSEWAERRETRQEIELRDARTGDVRPAKVVGRDADIIDRLRNADGYEKD